MRKEDKEAIVRLYEDRFASFGYDVKSVGWNTRQDQFLRYKILCEIDELSGANVCDIGCGFGDLSDYLNERYKEFTYTGVDISPSLVRKAVELHPNHKFYCLDISDENPPGNFDYFLLSGSLSYRIENNMQNTTQILSRLFDLSNKGVAVNFLSTYVNFQRQHNYHYSPEEIFSFSKTLTQWVTLRHDYPLWEFTVYLYKRPSNEKG